MARTQTFYARVEPELKEKAEAILAKLGMSPSDAVNIFLSQVVLEEGLPFEVKVHKPTREEAIEWLKGEVKKAEESIDRGNFLSSEEVRHRLGIK